MIKRMTWTVVFRESNSSQQEEFVRYTAEAANSFAEHIQDNGGVAVVVEGEEEVSDEAQQPANRSGLTWN